MTGCLNHPADVDTRPCRRCERTYCFDCLVRLRGADYCLDCKTEEIRDIQSGVDRSRLDYASTSRRFQALFVDGLVQGCAAYSTLIPLMLATHLQSRMMDTPAFQTALLLLWYAAAFTVPFAYEALMLSWRGQTLGKILYGIKVVTPTGADLSRGQCWGRAGMRIVLNFCALVDYVPAFFDKERRCIHDLAAKTRVVRLPR